MIQRRAFITLLGGAAAWPLAARAQQVIPRTIGVLGSATPAAQGKRYAVFAERLRALGWIEKRNVTFEYRWAHGRTEAYSEIAAEFVRLKVDVIVTSGTAAVAAAKQTTSAIPIVFTTAGDPVGTGLVASLARPGGNVTGSRSSKPTWPQSDSSFCARSFRACGGWGYWATSAVRALCSICANSRQPLARSALIRSCSKSGEPRILRLRSRR